MTSEHERVCAGCGGSLELPAPAQLCFECFAAGVPRPTSAEDVAQTILETDAQSVTYESEGRIGPEVMPGHALAMLTDVIEGMWREVKALRAEQDVSAANAANAHLIAAAPELLEACRAFVEWYPVSRWMSGTDAFAIAQRAIAKAEGRS